MDFYQEVLNLLFLVPIWEGRLPSPKAPVPYMHLFLDGGNGSILAFFKIPTPPPMGRDPNTPAWVQHIAFRVENEEALLQAKKEVEAHGIDVVGPTDHGIIKSIYFFDPNGHRLELTCVTGTDAQMRELKAIAPTMLDEWSRNKKVVTHASWLHEKEFSA